MFKLSLIVIFFALASANLGVWPLFESATVASLECFLQNDINLVYSTVWDQYNGASTTFADNHRTAKTAGITYYDAVVAFNDTFLPEEICGQTVHVLPSDFNGRVWLSLYSDWTRAVGQRMKYLDSVVQTCQKHGLNVGIYSDVNTWTKVFGNKMATSGTIQALPLFYENFNDDDTFDDFQTASFGNWAAPTMKGFVGNIKWFCGAALRVKTFFE